MEIIPLERFSHILEDKPAVIRAVRQGFMDHAQGKTVLPAPVQMLFRNKEGELRGDCHVKTAQSGTLPFFCIKVATGFYNNSASGLPVNNGLVLVMSSQTGAPLALLQDDGHLTSVRTAAAGALAASMVSGVVSGMVSGTFRLGIVGTGHQAGLQARWISAHCNISELTVWGRSQQKAEALAASLKGAAPVIKCAGSVSELCAQSRVILTATPATTPLIAAQDIRPGHHIVAIGADSPGKQELHPEILGLADFIYTDDHDQCLHHGEFGHGVRAGVINAQSDLSFGKSLADPAGNPLTPDSVSVVDLTGLGAQDLAIASLVYGHICAASIPNNP